MAILLNTKHKNPDIWFNALKSIDKDLDIRIYPNIGDIDEIDFIITWKFEKGFFNQFKNLKVINSVGAGIDYILNDESINKEIKIIKIVDESLTNSMWEYCLSAVIYYTMKFNIYQSQQKENKWKSYFPKSFSNTTVGVIGLGSIGGTIAKNLANLGFKVKGYSNSKKIMPNVKTYSKDEALEDFLDGTDIILGILPLTAQTENFYDKTFFKKMQKGSIFINVGRGAQVNEHDLLSSLNNSHLNGAMLDVFREEPLPLNNPLWNHPKVNLTPHIASITNAYNVAPQIITNYKNMLNKKELLNVIEREKGY